MNTGLKDRLAIDMAAGKSLMNTEAHRRKDQAINRSIEKHHYFEK